MVKRFDLDVEQFYAGINDYNPPNLTHSNPLYISMQSSGSFGESGAKLTSFTAKYANTNASFAWSNISERALIQNVTATIESAGAKGFPIIGSNIRSETLPLLYERSKQYGLQDQVKKVIYQNQGKFVEELSPKIKPPTKEILEDARSLMDPVIKTETPKTPKVGIIGQFAKSKVGKYSGMAARYAGTFAAMNLIMPGDFATNAASSVAFDIARYTANKKGYGGWKSIAAGFVGAGAFRTGQTIYDQLVDKEPIVKSYNLFSGKDDDYNTIEGLHPGGSGLGAQNLKENSDFGSGWVRRAYKAGLSSEDIAEHLLKSATKLGKTGRETGIAATKSIPEFKFFRVGQLEEKYAEPEFLKLGKEIWGTNKDVPVESELVKHYKDWKSVEQNFVPVGKPGETIKVLHGTDTPNAQAISNRSPINSYIANREEQISKMGKETQGLFVYGEENWHGTMSYAQRAAVRSKTEEAFLYAEIDASKAYRSPFYPKEYVIPRHYQRHIKNYKIFKDFDNIPKSNKFSGKDDAYNTIEGLHPGAEDTVSSVMMQLLSDFGSGWDPMKSLAKSIFGGSKNKAFSKLRQSDEWLSMLSGAKQVKELSSGSFGTTYLMEGSFRGKAIKFVKKTPESELTENAPDFLKSQLPNKQQRIEALAGESKSMSFMENRISPSVYGYDDKQKALYMELMPGKTVHELMQEGHKLPIQKIEKTIKREINVAARKGIVNTDIHTGNIMFDPETNKVSWIDWGMGKSSPTSLEWREKSSEAMEAVAQHKLFTPLRQSSQKVESFFDDWGSVNSLSPASKSSSAPKTAVNSIGLDKTLLPQTEPNMAFNKTMPTQNQRSIRKQQLSRIKRFNKISQEAVGLGHRAAKNAGRRHQGFNSTRKA